MDDNQQDSWLMRFALGQMGISIVQDMFPKYPPGEVKHTDPLKKDRSGKDTLAVWGCITSIAPG